MWNASASKSVNVYKGLVLTMLTADGEIYVIFTFELIHNTPSPWVYALGIGHMAAAKGLRWIMADKNFIAHAANI